MALEGGSPSTMGVKTCWGFPLSPQSHHTPVSQADFKEQHRCLWRWMQNHTGCREPQHQEHRGSTGWAGTKQRGLEEAGASSKRDTSPRTSREGDMQKGQKQVRPTNFGGMLLQEAGGEHKKGAETTEVKDGERCHCLSMWPPAEAAGQSKSSLAFRQECPRKPPHAPQDKGQCFVETSITAAQPDKP